MDIFAGKCTSFSSETILNSFSRNSCSKFYSITSLQCNTIYNYSFIIINSVKYIIINKISQTIVNFTCKYFRLLFYFHQIRFGVLQDLILLLFPAFPLLSCYLTLVCYPPRLRWVCWACWCPLFRHRRHRPPERGQSRRKDKG